MSIYQDKAKECKCCGKHVPLPIVLKEFNQITLCPTTYYNVIEYSEMWKRMGHRPPGNLSKHFSEYVQTIAQSSIEGSGLKDE
jgi:hypothetical protein